MMEEDDKRRYLCRFCSKSFSSGKSLGGHIRVHLPSPAKKIEEMEVPLSSEFDIEEDVGEASYGLRENPKKSWRISGSRNEDLMGLNICRECGKGFSSLKALSGHMRSHSQRGQVAVCKECGKEFDSMRAMFGHMSSHSVRLKVSSESDDYEISCPIRKKRSRTRSNKITSDPFELSVVSSVGVDDYDQLKEAAMCLMILSSGVWSSDKLDLMGTFSSDYNSSVVNLEASTKGVNDRKKMKKRRENNLDVCVTSSSKFEKFNSGVASDEVSVGNSLSNTQPKIKKELISQVEFNQDDLDLQTKLLVDQAFELKKDSSDQPPQNATNESEIVKDFSKNSKFKSTKINETVDSCIELKLEKCGFNEADFDLEKLNSNEESFDLKRRKEHECSICFKVFTSGQALGGHKRAHYMGLTTERRGKEMITVEDQELPDDKLDLNFPSIVEEDPTIGAGLKPWWAGYDCEREPLAIFN